MRRSLPCLVRDVGHEMAQLGTRAALLQEQLGDMAPDHAGIIALQSLDALTQGLTGLAEFLKTLAADLPADCEPDMQAALSAIPLGALATRLAAGGVVEQYDHELELFG